MYINKNKTFRILQTFSIEEFYSCIKYIKNNTKHKDILVCMSFIKSHFPKFNIEKEKLYQLIYPNQEFIDYRYRNLLYRMDLLIKKFLDNNLLSKDTIPHLIHIKNLKNINDKRNYTAQINSLKKKKEKKTIENYFLAYDEMENLQNRTNRQADTKIQEVHIALDQHYVHEKLKLVCLSINDNIINGREYELGFFNQIESEIESIIENKISITYLLYESYLFQDSNDTKYFKNVVNKLKLNKYIDSEELRLVFTMCINYAIRHINKGHFDYFNDLFNIYKAQIKAKAIYSTNEIISAVTIKNIITVSLRLNEYKWTEKFIEDHKLKLLPIQREEIYHYLLARLYHSKKEYNKAQKYLLMSEPLDFLNNLSSRVLLCKCLYDSDDIDQLDNTLQNFKIYLMRHKNATYHYKFHTSFIKYLKKIIQKKIDIKAAKELKATLQNETQVAEKAWLLSLLN